MTNDTISILHIESGTIFVFYFCLFDSIYGRFWPYYKVSWWCWKGFWPLYCAMLLVNDMLDIVPYGGAPSFISFYRFFFLSFFLPSLLSSFFPPSLLFILYWVKSSYFTYKFQHLHHSSHSLLIRIWAVHSFLMFWMDGMALDLRVGKYCSHYSKLLCRSPSILFPQRDSSP